VRTFTKILGVSAVAATVAVAPALGTVGSVVASFPARIYGHGQRMMPVGMAFADGSLWMMYVEGVLAKRACPSGSVLATYDLFQWGAYGLSYDGNYFWTAWQPHIGPSDLYKINPANMSIVASYRVNSPYPIRNLAWDGARFWTNMLEDQYKVHEMTNAGSVISTYAIPYIYPKGMAFIPNLPVGPRLVEGDYGTMQTTFYVYKVRSREVNYTFVPAIPQEHALAGCWDGRYLWTFGNFDPGGNEYCYQIVAWEPFPGVVPASLGKVKAIYR
jgi:hypothetical protein